MFYIDFWWKFKGTLNWLWMVATTILKSWQNIFPLPIYKHGVHARMPVLYTVWLNELWLRDFPLKLWLYCFSIRRNPRGAVDSQPLHLTSPLFDQQDDDDDGSAALLSSCSPDFASSYIHQTAVPGGSPKSQKTPSLFRVLVSVYGITLLQAHLCKLVCDVLTFVGPVLQR